MSCGGENAKGKKVRAMFDSIAGRYDLMNRVMTLGQDQRWRLFVVSKAGVAGGVLLDLATGTGDIAALAKEKNPDCSVIGGDFSLQMLAGAGRRFAGSGIDWLGCDACRLPFAENTFDAVTFGYLLRNVEDRAAVLREVLRVLKPGGRVICLDTTRPAKNLFYPGILFYMHFIVPLLGRILAGGGDAYAYLVDSTLSFYSADALADLFAEAGFLQIGYRKFMLGTVAVHWGEKP